MESSSPLIVEISSDEEVGFGDIRKGGGYGVGGGEFGDKDDCDWLSELLGEVGGNKEDDSEDVVLVSENFRNPPKKPRLEPLKPSTKVIGVEGDDDDCVVLDGDPDKSVVEASCKVDDGGGNDDDVEIVGEKGEVACRDFPHARHLCVKFLFASTRHEIHCSQCHCYVCDSLAPCTHWGTGVSSIDHCHATDKDEYWRAERKRMKKGNNPMPAVPHINNNSLLGAFFQPTQALAPTRPVATHFSAMSSNVSAPNAVNQGRTHLSGCAIPVYIPRPQLVHRSPVFKQHGLVGASPNNIHPYRSQLSKNPLSNVLERNKVLLKGCRVFQTPVVNGRHGTHQRNTGSRPIHSVQRINYPQGINVSRANYVPSQPQIHSRPYSSCLTRDPIRHQSQSQTHTQPYAKSNNFVSAVPLQPHVASHPSVGKNFENLFFPQPHVFGPHSPVPSQAVASYQSDAGNASGSELNSRFKVPSNQSAGNNFGSQPSQPQANVNPPSLRFDIPNDFQQGNHTQNGIDSSSNDFGLAWDSQCQSTSPIDNIYSHLHSIEENDNRRIIEPVDNFQQQGVVLADNSSLTNDAGCQFPESIRPNDFGLAWDSQCQSTAPTDNICSQLDSVEENDNRQSIEPVDNFQQQGVVLADNSNLTSDAGCQFPESIRHDTLDFQFDSWMFENHSLPGVLEVPVSPLWNAFSPEPASVDTGNLFDF